jgi:BirA family transcriptional regulator, biotin operon repressor / biotin---[acetyl-CoA-carboxylase] ligase
MVRARRGAAEGLWLRARRQTGGRGRLGRQWESPVGNIYSSTLVRPTPNDPPLYSLAFVAALAVFDLMAPYCADGSVTLKWPNDILLNGAKACGMLLESGEGAVVVGIGVNVVTAPQLPDRATAALAGVAIRPLPDLDLLMHDLATHFSQRLHQWRLWPIAQMYQNWCDRAHPIGTPLSVNLDEGVINGAFAGLGEDGALRLTLSDGTIRSIYAGDVSLTS